jgi:TolB-like protein
MTFSFATHQLDPSRHELRRAGEIVHLEPQVFDLLLHLVRNRDRTVSKDEIVDQIWKGRIVSDAAITSRIKAARKAVGDNGADQIVIKTFHKRGFRFVADVAEPGGPDALRDPEPRPGERSVRISNAVAPNKCIGSVAEPNRCVAVLPFANISRNAPEQEYFAQGLTQDVIRLLGRCRWLTVLSQRSTSNLKSSDIDAREVGQALGARYLVRGSVRKSGERVRITVEVVATGDGSQLWSEAFDLPLADVFEIQETMATQIVAIVEPELALAEQQLACGKPPGSLGAWDCCQRGEWKLFDFTYPGLREAQALFRRALELEPHLARARADLAYVLLQNALYGDPANRSNLLQEALREARAAVTLDARDSRCHFALGRVQFLRGNLEEAIVALEEAIHLSPSYAQAYFGLGFALAFSNREEEAIALLEHAAELSPRDPHLWTFHHARSMAHFSLEEFESAEFFARKAARLPNATYFPFSAAVASLGALGRFEEARAMLPLLLEKKPTYTRSHARHDFFFCKNALLLDRYMHGLSQSGLPK